MKKGFDKKSLRYLLAALLAVAPLLVVFAAPSGSVPSGLPPRVTVGLFEDTGQTWMRSSGAKWDARYRYFTKGWVNNWGWGNYDGSWGLAYMRECDQQGYIPAIQYYQMNNEAGGGESAFYSKTQNAATMKSYFGDFKLLMERAKDFGKPVMILLEADGFAYMQMQSGNNPNAYSAVKDTGLPELSGLPNTAAGWGLAFLQIKKAVGANNAILGIHISGWASGKDLFLSSLTDALQPEVDKVYNFLAPLGLGANVTGIQYDVLVGDPLDRDSDFYRLIQGQDRWWDPADNASISSKSFNRYAEWLKLWNRKAGKRWVLWQIPLGNSNHANVNNNGGAAEGYKDNRPEYFFGPGAYAHFGKFAESGVISLLFGAGSGGQSSYQNDTYTDGQLYMKSRAGVFLNNGGFALPAGASPTPTPNPSPTASPVPSASPPRPSPSPSASGGYTFDASTQAWSSSGGMITSVARATSPVHAGSGSLRVNFNGAAGTQQVRVSAPTAPAGATVTFRVWIPSGMPVSSVQPYVLQGASGGWTWTGNWQPASAIGVGSWTTIQVKVPSSAKTPLYELGVQFTTRARWSGSVYVDTVQW